MNNVVYIVEIVGTIAFALSGALTALKKRMDLLGVIVLGLTTAVGGGIIRDLLLGITPPKTFRDPVYAAISIGVACFAFIAYGFRNRFSEKSSRVYNNLMLVMDSVGLGAFTVTGVATAIEAPQENGVFLLVFVGTLTGVGGGVLRDIFARDMPYIFYKHIYAVASIVGALTASLLWKSAGKGVAMYAGMAIVIIIRLLSAYYRWNLPRVDIEKGANHHE